MITQERLKELLDYDPFTGVWRWKVSTSNRVCVGDIAGHIDNTWSYNRIHVDGKSYRASRLAFLFMTGIWPEEEVDHINRITSDDRWCNLRLCNRQQNNHNRNKNKNNTSGHKGVRFRKDTRKWIARIYYNGKSHSLGNFDTFEEAVASRMKAEMEMFGEFGDIK